MLTLIAESKTMNATQREIDVNIYSHHRPEFENKAERLIDNFAGLTLDEIHATLGLSMSLSQKFQRLVYDFPNKSMGYPAISGFSGVVFRYIDPRSLSAEELEFAEDHMRIISSLYGCLRPLDIIKPYRFNFSSPSDAHDGKSLGCIWKKDNTVSIVRHLQDTGQREVVNMLPLDASRSIDWKVVKRYAKVYHIEFKQVSDGGDLVTPPATRLKELRGRLARKIIITNTDSVEELRHVSSHHYEYAPEQTYPGTLTYITA